MPDVNYIITIKNEASEGSSPGTPENIVTPTPSKLASRNAGGQQDGDGLLKDPESKKRWIRGMAVYHTVKSIGAQIAYHDAVATVQLRTGSSEAQEIASAWYSGINTSAGILEKAATGAAIGGGVGAVVGTVVGVAQALIGLNQRYRDLLMAEALESVSLRMNYIRAGANGSRHT